MGIEEPCSCPGTCRRGGEVELKVGGFILHSDDKRRGGFWEDQVLVSEGERERGSGQNRRRGGEI